MALKAAENEGYAKVVEVMKKNGYEMSDGDAQVRNRNGNSFKVGDIIKFVEPLQFFETTFDGSDIPVQCTVVGVERNGKTKYQSFFPSMLGKVVTPVEVDKDRMIIDLEELEPQGEASAVYLQYLNQDIKTACEALMKEGDIKVTEVTPIKVRRFNDDSKVNPSRYYRFDFA